MNQRVRGEDAGQFRKSPSRCGENPAAPETVATFRKSIADLPYRFQSKAEGILGATSQVRFSIFQREWLSKMEGAYHGTRRNLVLERANSKASSPKAASSGH